MKEYEIRFKLTLPEFIRIYKAHKENASAPESSISLNSGDGKRKEIFSKTRQETLHKKRLLYDNSNPRYTIVISDEEKIKDFDENQIRFIRYKIRRRAKFGKWELHFTIVEVAKSFNTEFLENRPTEEDFNRKLFDSRWTAELEAEYNGKAPSEKRWSIIANKFARQILEIEGGGDDDGGNNTEIDQKQPPNKTSATLDELAKSLKRFRSEFRSVLSRPTTITWFGLSEFMSGKWYMTEKTDGERCIIDMGRNIVTFAERTEPLPAANQAGKKYEKDIYDAEFYRGTYVIFDILTRNGKPLGKFSERLSEMATLRFPTDKFVIKKYTKLTDHKKQIPKFYKSIKQTHEEGLIFVQDLEITPELKREIPYTIEKIFKWKKFDTIDFLVESDQVLTVGAIPKIAKALNAEIVSISKPNYANVKFQPARNRDAWKLPIVGKVEQGKVWEFKYEDGKWYPIRQRDDKKTGNGIEVAEEIFSLCERPISLDDPKFYKDRADYFRVSSQTKALELRKFNSRIKAMLLYYIRNSDNVVDIGSGKGQDLFVYDGFRTKEGLFIDIDPAAMEQLERIRYKFGMPVKYEYSAIPTEKHTIVNTYIGDMSVECPTELLVKHSGHLVINFAIHYLLRGGIDNLKKITTAATTRGDFFIFTCFDGAAVNDFLNKNGGSFKHPQGFYGIKFDSGGKNQKKEVLVCHPFSGGEYYPEPVVDLNDLITQLSSHFRLISTHSFGAFHNHPDFEDLVKKMSEHDLKYSSLYAFVVLQRIL